MAGTCTMPDCEARHVAKGLCNKHYHKANRHKYLARIKAANRRHYEEHREERIAYAIQWNKDHPKEAREVVLRWKREHPERVAAAHRRWRQANPGKVVEHAKNRRVRKRRLETQPAESGSCGVCRLPLVPDAPRRSRLMTTVGHEPPISRALLYTVERPEHLHCNWSKGNRLDSELSRDHIRRLRAFIKSEARAA